MRVNYIDPPIWGIFFVDLNLNSN